MSIFRLAVLGAAAVVLASCGAGYLAGDAHFSDSETDAMLVVNKSAWPGDLYLRAVDTGTNRFTGQDIVIDPGSTRLALNDSGQPGHLHVVFLQPGDYAIVRNIYTTRAEGDVNVSHRCFSRGTSVYRLAPGKISYIEQGTGALKVVTRGAVSKIEGTIESGSLEVLRQTLADYENLTAEAVEPPVVARITFEGQNIGPLKDIQCPVGDKFELASEQDILAAAREFPLELRAEEISDQESPDEVEPVSTIDEAGPQRDAD